MEKISFYKNRISLNILTSDLENAKRLEKATDGNVVLGLLTKDYDTNQEAITNMKKYQKEVANKVSVGLGAGDANQWKMVCDVSAAICPQHINQVFTAVGYTRGKVGDNPWINCLVTPSEKRGLVEVNTGPLSKAGERALVPIETAILMAKEMGANSIKFYPMKGLQSKDQYIEVCKMCAKNEIGVEPTGGIDLENFEEIIKIAVDAGVQKIIPHVYSSIIDPESGETRVADVERLFEIIKEVVR